MTGEPSPDYEPSPHYRERVQGLDNVVRNCITLSQACAGFPAPTSAHYYASVLFTSLCTRGVSLAILAPHSPWSTKIVEQWDFSSMAGIVRSILEVRLTFFYLCSEPCSSEEWECRWNLFNLHDCISRFELFRDSSGEAKQLDGFSRQAHELRSRLNANPFFMGLPQKQRNKLIKGRDAYLSSLQDIAVRARIDLSTFRWLYRLLSAQVHGLPMSFYRMGQQNRGRGVFSEAEEGYTSLCISFAISLLVAARDEMRAFFRGR